VLSRLGCELVYPPAQTCCGQPAFNAGHWPAARKVARTFLRSFRDSELIVAPSGSCVAMVRNHYPRLFEGHRAELADAAGLRERIFELSEFIVRRLGVVEVGARYHGKVTYHDSCHLLRGLGIRDEPRALLSHVNGLELVEMTESDRCCGFGGTFALKFSEISAAMTARKVERIRESGAGTVAVADLGCLINIKGRLHRAGLPIRSLHLAEILAAESK
jgi:L-lactate dehydrogenase complex protein LldE